MVNPLLSSTEMSNKQISELLRKVAASYTIKDQKKYYFQIVAYNKAADSIENSTQEVSDLYKEGKLESLSGIGSSIKSHLEELLEKGEVTQFKWVFDGIPDSVFPLLKIPSFGPKKAFRLVKDLKLMNSETVINDLENAAKDNKISNLGGFGEKSQTEILRSINDFKLGKTKDIRMNLPFAMELANRILVYLGKCECVEKAEVLGSLRRMKPTIGDIDIAISSNNPDKVIKHFTDFPSKERIIEKGPATASIAISGGRQVDVMIQKPESFGSLLQHFTGSKNHNIHLRELALKKGLSLSEYGIKKDKKLLKFSTEEEFYNFLGMDWIPPEIREDKGEIEKAENKSLPDLIEVKDIRGDLHMHSNYPLEPSHDLGRDTMEDMIKKATKLGYKYIGFSEHNPSILKHTDNQIIDILKKRSEKIEQLYSDNKSVRLYKLLEVDILAKGGIALPEKALEFLDGMIVSVHSSFSLDKKTMTERILSALSHPKARFLAHPTGRKINQRPGYDLDWEKIFEVCLKGNKALEVNSWPDRLDLPDEIIRSAIKNKVKIVINTDSHAAYQLSMVKYGVAMARRGWATKEDVLNAKSEKEFSDWLTKGGD